MTPASLRVLEWRKANPDRYRESQRKLMAKRRLQMRSSGTSKDTKQPKQGKNA
jgi:hypothetical protein